MKKLVFLNIMIALLSLIFTSCKKDVRALDTGLTPVSSLSAPADGFNIKLQPTTGAAIVFSWDSAHATDGGLVLYEIAFDKADGDFSHPLFKSVSDGGGAQTQATMSQKDLNKIASMAGIASLTSGKVKWAVYASKVTNEKISAMTRTLTIERPAGFAVLPDAMYITGSATEGGTDVTKAIAMKKTANGAFELYTSLKPGTYQFTDQPNANGTRYYIDANGLIQTGNSTTTAAGADQPYRLSLDFSDATTKQVAIQSLGLYMSAYNKEIGQLNYIGNSTWEAASIPVAFYPFSWGRDERYKFIMHTSAGLEYIGSKNADNVPPTGQSDSYFYLTPVTNDQWNNTYKFAPAADLHNVKVDVFFKPASPYTHQVTVL